jgi:tripartite-type tricarboxylate transporter receptor subunit TctC
MTRVVLAALALAAALPAGAQYPERPLNVIAGYPAGGMVDIVARAVSEGMKKRYPAGVVVVNRPGAGGGVGMAETVRAKPDGYTIILTPLSALVIVPQVCSEHRSAGESE